MIKFVDLEDTDQGISIVKINPKSISNVTPGSEIIDGIITEEEKSYPSSSIIPIDKIVIDKISPEEEEPLCIKEGCSISSKYGCTDGSGYFSIHNLFSELTDEYQRTLARINLGIADEYALIWGNIKGNLLNQKDLYNFVIDSVNSSTSDLIDEINLKLSQWAYEINESLKLKANIYSPIFTGEPITTLPDISDNSGRIASTEWVNAKIKEASVSNNIDYFITSPEYICYGDEPVDVVVSWEYYNQVDSQTINNIELDPSIRTYTFNNIESDFTITLDYTYEGKNESKVTTFQIKYPIYYGTSEDYTTLEKTVNNKFLIDAKDNEYMYIFIPNGSESKIEVNSIIGGFVLEGTIELYNNIYYIYKSAYTGLGKSYIKIDSFNDDYYSKTNYDTLKELLDTKADKLFTYTKKEVDSLISEIKKSIGQETVLYRTFSPNIETTINNILNTKKYITKETDPTVPKWAKQPKKPTYSLEELGAEKQGAANQALIEAKSYINSINNTLVSNLKEKANKSELFSKEYKDLINVPESFTPTKHTHSISDIENINSIIDTIKDINTTIESLKERITNLENQSTIILE